jgi:hypothetical protein
MLDFVRNATTVEHQAYSNGHSLRNGICVIIALHTNTLDITQLYPGFFLDRLKVLPEALERVVIVTCENDQACQP